MERNQICFKESLPPRTIQNSDIFFSEITFFLHFLAESSI